MKASIPYQITLKASSRKFFGVGILSAGFALLAYWMLASGGGTIAAWLGILFFGFFCAPICFYASVKSGHLKLTHSGFEQSLMGRQMSRQWTDVSEFTVIKISTGIIESKTVVIFSERYDRKHSSESGDVLSETFGKKPHELAALMNAFRIRALENETLKDKHKN